MPKIFVTNRLGEERVISAPLNHTLMEVLRDEGMEIEALCGGCCSCATCHVYISSECASALPTMSEDEDLLLEGILHRDFATSRLSCQVRISGDMDGLSLTIAPAE